MDPTPLSGAGLMMTKAAGSIKIPVYEAPWAYVVSFYVLLVTWTLVSGLLILSKVSGMSIALLLMIGFFIAYTWYFSLGISYRIKIEDDGAVRLTSLRRTVKVPSEKIKAVEGPPFPIWVGFIRLRLEGEKVYLFFVRKPKVLQPIFSFIHTANPDIKFRGYGRMIG
jgi:hypothetical protein